jgi:hypothetical protein
MLKTFDPWQGFFGVGIYVEVFAFALSDLSNLAELRAGETLLPFPFKDL